MLEQQRLKGSNGGVSEGLRAIGSGLVVVIFSLILLYKDPRFFWHDDFQMYHLAGFYEMAKIWDRGEFPLLSPTSWVGGALTGEYQYGTFSLFINLCVILVYKLKLSLQNTAAVISIVHLAILSAGSFCLARQRKLSSDLSLVVALCASLNGWILLWGAVAWIPALTSFAWFPWTWWAFAIAVDENRGVWRFIPSGIFIYLILTAGWPFSNLMIAMLTLWFVVRYFYEKRNIVKLWPIAASWMFGLGLSAPALLMLAEYVKSSIRGETGLILQRTWVVPLSSLPGLILPSIEVPWIVFDGLPRDHISVELASGLAPFIAFLTALFLLRKKYIKAIGWELALFLIIFILTISPSFSLFRWSFRWLPFLHLLIALLGAEAIKLLRYEREVEADASGLIKTNRTFWFNILKQNPGFWALVLILIIWPIALFFSLKIEFVLIAAGWAIVEQAKSVRPVFRTWMPVVVVLLAFWVTYKYIPTNLSVPAWDFRASILRPEPLDPTIRYISFYGEKDLYNPIISESGYGRVIRPGNASMYAGLELINGYSPILSAGLSRFLNLFSANGFTDINTAKKILNLEDQLDDRGLPALMGVDGYIISAHFEPDLQAEIASLTARGWILAARTDEGLVFHRPGKRSLRVRAFVIDNQSQSSPVRLTNIQEANTFVSLDVESISSDLEPIILFSRPWYPGYKAKLNGKEIPVDTLNSMMPVVKLPIGAKGHLELLYRPNSLIWGVVIAISTLLLSIGIIIVSGIRKRYLVHDHEDQLNAR
jgi:hypothetical protein